MVLVQLQRADELVWWAREFLPYVHMSNFDDMSKTSAVILDFWILQGSVAT